MSGVMAVTATPLGRRKAIPLGERRCTKCSRGVAAGARFYRRRECGPNSYCPVCVDCAKARMAATRREHGGDCGRHARTVVSPDDLSPRQRDVLRLLAAGLDDGQIARRLFIAPKTVSNHLTAIYARMPEDEGNKRRVLAARWLWEHDRAAA